MGLVQQHLTFGTLQQDSVIILNTTMYNKQVLYAPPHHYPHLEAGGVPGEVGGDPQYELVLNETSTAYTGTAPIT